VSCGNHALGYGSHGNLGGGEQLEVGAKASLSSVSKVVCTDTTPDTGKKNHVSRGMASPATSER
jgi:hypothetical protein